MLPIGTRIHSTYNESVRGTIVGYGFVSDSFVWWTGSVPSDEIEPAYLIALADKIDLTRTPLKGILSVMVLEARNAKVVE